MDDVRLLSVSDQIVGGLCAWLILLCAAHCVIVFVV